MRPTDVTLARTYNAYISADTTSSYAVSDNIQLYFAITHTVNISCLPHIILTLTWLISNYAYVKIKPINFN